MLEALTARELTLEQFESDRHIRFKRLRLLLERGELDADLHWSRVSGVPLEPLIFSETEIHPVGMTFQHAHGRNETLNGSRAEWLSPFGRQFLFDPPPATGAKVSISDTDHYCGACGDHTVASRSFLRGHNPAYMDSLDDEPRKAIRNAIGQTRRYAERIDLAAARPRGDLCSTRYCLASPGREYLVYQPQPDAFAVDVRGTGGSFAVEWFDPGLDRTIDGGTVSGRRIATFTPPFGGESVLYLRRIR